MLGLKECGLLHGSSLPLTRNERAHDSIGWKPKQFSPELDKPSASLAWLDQQASPAPRLILYRRKEDALVQRPRLKYRVTINPDRRWR